MFSCIDSSRKVKLLTPYDTENINTLSGQAICYVKQVSDNNADPLLLKRHDIEEYKFKLIKGNIVDVHKEFKTHYFTISIPSNDGGGNKEIQTEWYRYVIVAGLVWITFYKFLFSPYSIHTQFFLFGLVDFWLQRLP